MKKIFLVFLSILIVTFSSCQDSVANKINSSSTVAKTDRITNQACSKNQLHFQQTHHLEEKC